MKQTTNYNLNKPEETDDFSVDHFNENADILDEIVGNLQTDVDTIKTELEDGVGDYTAPTIAAAPAITSIPDTSSVPISGNSGVLSRVTWSNLKAVLRAVFDLVYAPVNHASPDPTYGFGTYDQYGHVKVINNLLETEHLVGRSLSAYQGAVLKKGIDDIQNQIDESTADNTAEAIANAAAITAIPNNASIPASMPDNTLNRVTFETLRDSIQKVTGGLDSEKPENPEPYQIYLAEDTQTVYFCFDNSGWKGQRWPGIVAMTQNEIDNFETGSLPDFTMILNIDSGRVGAVINGVLIIDSGKGYVQYGEYAIVDADLSCAQASQRVYINLPAADAYVINCGCRVYNTGGAAQDPVATDAFILFSDGTSHQLNFTQTIFNNNFRVVVSSPPGSLVEKPVGTTARIVVTYTGEIKGGGVTEPAGTVVLYTRVIPQ